MQKKCRCCEEDSDEVVPGQCEECKRKDAPITIMCPICDEWEYCTECADVCQCGVGPLHYLCPDDKCRHYCESEECPKRLCMNAAIPGYEGRIGGESLWCKDHRPPVSRQMKELVLESLSFEELEEAAAQKRSKCTPK